MKWWSRLRREWVKNDGKPQDQWAPGRDLKTSVLTLLAIAFLVAQIGLTVWAWFR